MTLQHAKRPAGRSSAPVPTSAALQPSVSMRLARLTHDGLQAQGVPSADILRRLGLSAAELARDDLRLGLAAHARLRPLLSQIGPERRDAPPPDEASWALRWPELAVVWLNQPSAAAAVECWRRYRPLIGSIDEVDLQLSPDRLVLAYRPHAGAHDDGAVCSALANFWIVREVLHQHERAHQLQLQIELAAPLRPRIRMDWQHRLQVPVRAGCGGQVDRLVVRGAGLHHVGAPYQALLGRCGEASLDLALAQLRSQPVLDNLVHRVQMMIAQHWDGHEGPLDEDPGALQRQVAEAMGCSRWTLRRQLESLGTSFGDVIEQLRAKRLPTLMTRADLSLLEVGWRLGFASASAFSHYARRRLGTSPSSWRRAHTAGLSRSACRAEQAFSEVAGVAAVDCVLADGSCGDHRSDRHGPSR